MTGSFRRRDTAPAQLNAVQRSTLHAISHSPTVLCLAENGRLNVCFWEICWSLRIFSRWNCTVKYMAFILWEREDEKKCFGSRGIRNSTGRKCEIGANIVKCLPPNHGLYANSQINFPKTNSKFSRKSVRFPEIVESHSVSLWYARESS